jgi:predicted DCC family thiol-disulfide oxidoreductase YuxK
MDPVSRPRRRLAGPAPRGLTVLYDEKCPFCVRCAAWLAREPSFLPLELLPAGGDVAAERYGSIPWRGSELVVVSDEGDVWAGAAGFVICLWALTRYREWSVRFAAPSLAPLAERVFALLSAERHRLARFFDHRCTGDTCGLRDHGGPYRHSALRLASARRRAR